jgi:hypothetical protein
MQTNRSNIGGLIGGALLIGFGILSLMSRVFRGLDWGLLWPFIIIGFGALFFVLMFASGKSGAAFAIPGSIVGGIGLVLLFQNITGRWESMSYFWTLIILFIGSGIALMGRHAGDENQRQAGLRVMKVGFILFVIFGVFFEMIFSSFGDELFPVLLILLGGYLVLSRSGLFGRKQDGAADNNPLPPAG